MMKNVVKGIAFALTFAASWAVIFTVAASADSGSAGDWRGESVCTVKGSPCHDEHALYHVEEPDSMGKLKIQMDKIVDGKPEIMGTVNCDYDNATATITCNTQRGVWKFNVTGNKMAGTLVLADGQLYRRITLTKDKPPKH